MFFLASEHLPIHGFNISVPILKVSAYCCVTEKFRATFELVWRGDWS